MYTAIFYILSNVCLLLPVPPLSSLSLCTLLCSTFCPLSDFLKTYLSCFRVTVSSAVFGSLSTVCLPQTVLSPVLCLYAHCYNLNFVNGISTKNCTTFVSVSLCALLFSKFCPVSLYRMPKRLLVLCHFVPLSSTVCPIFAFLTFKHLFSLCHYAECCLLQFVYNLPVLHTVPSGGSVSLCPLLYFIVCRLPVCISQCTVCWYCVTECNAVF